MNELQKDLIYLLTCAVNGITPDAARVQNIDLNNLYKLAKFHSVRAAANSALEKAGIKDEKFREAYHKSIRKNIMLDMELEAIFADFEKTEIWYMPLKGSILKELYPENGIREMADNDVLYDSSRQDNVKEIMLAHGYTAESVGKGNHDVYMKPPVLNFELHTSLFSIFHGDRLLNYYRDIKNILIKDEGRNFGYHFSDEDFYIYITAHEWKHYNGSGTGIRSLLDSYVYVTAKGESLDWKYIKEQLEKLGIGDFEEKRRNLALKLFSDTNFPELDDSESEMLMYYLTAGAYGTFENGIKKKLDEQGRAGFWFNSIFISRDKMTISVPFTAKSPLLYPAGVVWRCIRVLAKRRDRLGATIKTVRKYGK